MDVLNASEASLCNAEVLTFLREERARLAKSSSENKNAQRSAGGSVATLILETVTSLEKATPAGSDPQQDPEKVRSFLSRLSPFGLTKNEKLMLLNHAPKSELEIHLLVEESEERLTDEQVNQILDIVDEVLGDGEQEENNAEEEGQGNEDQ